jgi:hypothetical protein
MGVLMPLYNNIPDWNGFEIQVKPVEPWRKRIRFWPYFVGQTVLLELVVKKSPAMPKGDLQFHVVEVMPDVEKPRIVTPTSLPERSIDREMMFIVRGSSRITGKGEVKYWVSNRGYNVDNEPIFTGEALNLDSWIIPILLMVLGPLIAFLSGLFFGLMMGG